MTDTKNSLLTTTSLTPDAGSAFIRPTEMERRHGRLMRAPDHDAGTGGGEGGGSEGGTGDGTDTGGEGGGEGAGEGAGEAGEGDDASDTSLLGKIGAKEGEKGGEGEGKKDGEGDDEGAEQPPEKYELTAPEGLELNDEVLAEVDPVFRELGLSNDQANKIMPLAGKFMERITAAQSQQHADMAADWAKEAKADQRIGGKNWVDTETFVARAFDTAAAGLGKDGVQQVADFRGLLDATGLGNHPVMIRMFRFYGERISEDTNFARGETAGATKQSREEILYPNDVPNKEGAK
jgi:hypothetical protein